MAIFKAQGHYVKGGEALHLSECFARAGDTLPLQAAELLVFPVRETAVTAAPWCPSERRHQQ